MEEGTCRRSSVIPALSSVAYHHRPPFEATATPKSNKDADEDLLPLVLDVLNEAEKIGLDYMDVEALKKLNKNKKESLESKVNDPCCWECSHGGKANLSKCANERQFPCFIVEEKLAKQEQIKKWDADKIRMPIPWLPCACQEGRHFLVFRESLM
ncbi:hypothetical protein V6N12_059948 [Hibiscus sabdariffa]|uniref:Uncharacterized protein n=1 Tax=Hibiscus sabdariffa TaxID=183260 RepID=A0ABR2D2Z9_9ROSI